MGRCGDTRHPKGRPLQQNKNSWSSFAYVLHWVGEIPGDDLAAILDFIAGSVFNSLDTGHTIFFSLNRVAVEFCSVSWQRLVLTLLSTISILLFLHEGVVILSPLAFSNLESCIFTRVICNTGRDAPRRERTCYLIKGWNVNQYICRSTFGTLTS